MSLIASGRLALSVLALCALTACGGGGSGPATITAKEGELVLIDAGDSAVPAKTYQLDTTYGDAAERANTPIGYVITVYPENSAFDTGLAFLESNPAKFLVGFWANASNDKTYGCRSSAWTQAELMALANAIDDQSILSEPVCAQDVAIDAGGRHATYSNVKMPADDGGTGSVVVSATFSWPAPVPGSLGGSGGGASVAVSAPPGPMASTPPVTSGSISVSSSGGGLGSATFAAAPAAPVVLVTTPN
jgi:hypothetical protein